MAVDLFGEEIITNPLLRDRFIVPPFSVINGSVYVYMKRKEIWNKCFRKFDKTRENVLNKNSGNWKDENSSYDLINKYTTSMFCPLLSEILYHWFVPKNGSILDPFAGGSVRGIVANYLGFKYTGIDIRQEQIDINRNQALDILSVNNQPNYYVGDSNEVLNGFNKEVDFVFSCPPYADLEVYSDLEGDVSNMPYIEFMKAYEQIIVKSCNLLKSGGYACFVVGEVRDKKGNYIGFVPDTINAFRKCGMNYYNEIIYLQPIGRTAMTCVKGMRNKKIGKVHQNVLIFKKP